jgi:hypothetical protein
MYDIQHCCICRPSNSTVSEDSGIVPRTVATTALAVRRSNHSARSHPQSARSHPHSARSHPHSARSHTYFFFCQIFFWGIFFSFCSYNIQHCFICRPSDSTVPTDAGIEPRTVATCALAVRRSNH